MINALEILCSTYFHEHVDDFIGSYVANVALTINRLVGGKQRCLHVGPWKQHYRKQRGIF